MNCKSKHNFSHNFNRVLEFLTLLNVEPYIFFIMFVFMLKRVPSDQLIQDKICLQKYNLSKQYCLELPHMSPEEDVLNKKSLILKEVTQFSLYTSIIATVPSLIATLLVGSWTDKYISAKKALLIAGAVASILESLISIANVYYFDKSQMFFLLAALPSSLTGGLLGVFTAFYAYIASTTPPKLRAMRMLVAEIGIFAAMPLGSLFGGKILNTSPTMKHGQLHNYTMVYLVGATSGLIALLWAIFRVNEKRDIKEFNKRFAKLENIEMQTKGAPVSEIHKQFDDNKHIHPLKLLFDFENIKDMIKTCCKKREKNLRLQIWLLFLTMLCYLMVHMGPSVFLYPFTQKVYDWNSEIYSNASAIGNLINALSTLLVAPILIKIIRVKDTSLSMIGLGAYFTQNIIRGVWLDPTGFYFSLLAGAMGSLTSAGIRTHFSKIVEPKELGKVFCLMSAIDSMAPLIASVFFSNIFNATMDTMPGISFIIVAGILLIPFFIMFWIDLCTELPDCVIKKIKENTFNTNESFEETIADVITDVTKM